MDWRERASLLALAAVAYLAFGGVLGAELWLAVLVIAVVAAFRFAPGFWRIVLAGLIGGAVSGLLILGPGFRVSMRMVALMDPGRVPEFTPGGTIFIVVALGGVIGALQGGTLSLVRRGTGIRSPIAAGILMGALFMGQLVLMSGDISEEFFELGRGPWVNIPMFSVFAVSYGIAAMALADVLERFRRPARRHTADEKVPA